MDASPDGNGDGDGVTAQYGYRYRSETTDSELGGDDSSRAGDDGRAGSSGDDDVEDEDDEKEEIVATPDMCRHCFNALLRELLPEESSPSRSHGVGNSRSPKRRHGAAGNDDDDDDDDADGNITDVDATRRERLGNNWQTSSYTPPAVDCPLFITWSKLRSDHRPLLLSEASSSGIATPATTTTTASSSNITDYDDVSSSAHAQQQHQQQQQQSDESEYEYDLRGCIGTLAPRPLVRALSEFAITSAFHDTRFDPITIHELPSLRVGVSLLVKYEECRHCLDWVVGVHGIIIKFESPPPSPNKEKKGSGHNVGNFGSTRYEQRTYSATYLPEVAYEQGWDVREAVASLVRKAGYRGAITDEWMMSPGGIRCTRYQSSKCRMSYREYRADALRAVHQRGGGRGGGGEEDPSKMTTVDDDDDVVTSLAAVDEAMGRQRRAKASRPCVHL